jgi:hypothetical protein
MIHEMEENSKPNGEVSKTTIAALKLSADEAFGYWFDFGDDWWHRVNVTKIEMDKILNFGSAGHIEEKMTLNWFCSEKIMESYMGKRMKKKSKKKKKSGNVIRTETSRASLSEPPTNPDIPVYDFFEDHHAGTSAWDLGECIESLIISIEDGYFVTWEAVVREEQGLPLSSKQEEMLDDLMSFSEDDYNGPTLYINGLPRPREPWYETLRKLVPGLILEPFKTYEIHNEMYHEDWPRIVESLETHGRDLTLPEGIDDPLEVIPPETLHRLWLQYCFDELSGLGQEDEMTLEDEEQKSWRVKDFIERLRECKNSVEKLGLTLEKLFQLVKLPPTDEKILKASMIEKLGIQSESQKLHEVL